MEKFKNILYIISMIILIFKIQYINSLAIPGRYPLTFLMSNGDIFLMTDEKIQVFDQSLKELKLERKVIDNLTKPDLRNIAQFSDGYIIALVEKTVFIFSEKGEYIHEIILENNADISADIESYSLNPYKYDTDYHYYI